MSLAARGRYPTVATGWTEDSVRYTHGHHESVLRSHMWRTVDNSAARQAVTEGLATENELRVIADGWRR